MIKQSTSDTVTSHDQWRNYASQALESGGTTTQPGVVHWDVSGRCEDPYRRTIKAMKVDLYGRVYGASRYLAEQSIGSANRYIDYDVPCRRCGTCLRRKAQHWRLRALSELSRPGRHWFGTLTFGPEARSRLEWAYLAAKRNSEAGSDARAVRLRSLAAAASPEVTRWWKRVRKESGAALRYLTVCEPHKDGWPHFHVLCHEGLGAPPVRHATLSRQWVAGFSNFKLVEDAAPAHYVAKYIAKSPLTRVRASVGYGQGANSL